MEGFIGFCMWLYVVIDVSNAQITYAPPPPCNWTEFISADIPADTEFLNLINCKDIQPQEGALTHLYQLNKISIANTDITEFPNITEVGGTLQDITMYNNKINFINPDYFIGFTQLKFVNLGTNWNLALLPDVPQFSTVTHFFIQRSAYRSIPKLSHAGEVTTLAMDNGVALVDFDKEDLRHYPKLTILGLDGNKFKTLPDLRYVNETLWNFRTRSAMQMTLAPVLHTVALRRIGFLDLRHTPNLRILPTLCHENLAALTIKVQGSGLDFCDCRNAWMKDAAERGTTLEGMDMSTTCGGLNWLNMTITELLAVCTTEPLDGPLKLASYHAQDIDRSCFFPVHSSLTGVSSPGCAAACAQTRGCLSASYLLGPGTCVLHAPPDIGPAPMESLDGWRYLGQDIEG